MKRKFRSGRWKSTELPGRQISPILHRGPGSDNLVFAQDYASEKCTSVRCRQAPTVAGARFNLI